MSDEFSKQAERITPVDDSVGCPGVAMPTSKESICDAVAREEAQLRRAEENLKEAKARLESSSRDAAASRRAGLPSRLPRPSAGRRSRHSGTWEPQGGRVPWGRYSWWREGRTSRLGEATEQVGRRR